MKENEELRYINDNLRREDLSPAQQELYDYLGRERYIDFCSYFGGTNLSVYKLDTLKRRIGKRRLKEDLSLYRSGCVSLSQLARMYQITERTVYLILAEGKK